MSDTAISVRGLTKSYAIAHNAASHSTLAEALLHRARRPFARTNFETFWALREMSFEVERGDVVGIIGRNGAGKSTLLKVLSRITEPTHGEVLLYGRVGSLLEVGTGFHPELTGRENIYLNGQILGMRKKEIDRQFDAIVDFSGCERFLDTPVKRYSSGMYVRLAFAVAAHLQSEILVVDEVLAVGDADFQRKCLGKMRDVATGGRTVLFVSHHMQSVASLCRSCLYLEGGRVKYAGAVREGIQHYMDFKPEAKWEQNAVARRPGSGEVRALSFQTDKQVYLSTDSIEVVMRVQPMHAGASRYFISLQIVNTQGVNVIHLDSRLLGKDYSAADALDIRYVISNPRLAQGDYFVNAYLCTEAGVVDRLENMHQIRIAPILPYPGSRGDIAGYALVYPDFQLSDTPVSPAAVETP
jgi:lipopolysaccharide transport system ATP-binding protein